METVCARCGKKGDQQEFIRNFCRLCYTSRALYSYKKEFLFDKCKHCHKIRFGKRWKTATNSELNSIIERGVIGDVLTSKFDNKTDTLHVIFDEEGKTIEKDFPISVQFRESFCGMCSKIVGGNYEVIVQLRGNEHEIERYAELLAHYFENENILCNIDKKKEGVDVYTINLKTTQKILKRLGLRARMTKKLLTVKEGRRLFRTTLLIRF